MFKRYLVFAGVTYYAGGGFEDFIESFECKQEAMNKVEDTVGQDAPSNIDSDNSFYCDWGQVIDQKTEEKWYYDNYKIKDKSEWEYRWE